MSVDTRLFVYGTLAPGQPNEIQLSGLEGTWVRATVRGKLYQLGRGAPFGYPGIVLDENEEQVQGQIFRSHDLVDHWSRLDEFEGDEYDRVVVSAMLDDGTMEQAFIYALKETDRKQGG